MRKEVGRHKAKIVSVKIIFSWWKIIVFCFLFSVFCLPSCSIPNLEKPECTEARAVVREFYSYHFGNDMKFSKENLLTRAKFLTDDLKQNLAGQTDGKKDYFTATDDYPKAFRIGGCEATSGEKALFEVVLFWRDDTRSEQREIKVETIKQNEKWLINKVENK